MKLEVIKTIHLLDDVGVWAITPNMILDYLSKKNKLTVSNQDILNVLSELSASDVIVWDATKSYIRPTAYIKKLT
jgi:hypothetical protein